MKAKKVQADPKNIEYGKTIKKRMINSGVKTQRELAEAAQIPYGVMRMIICGQFQASPKYKKQIAAALRAAN